MGFCGVYEAVGSVFVAGLRGGFAFGGGAGDEVGDLAEDAVVGSDGIKVEGGGDFFGEGGGGGGAYRGFFCRDR